jgi:hypothetical protein
MTYSMFFAVFSDSWQYFHSLNALQHNLRLATGNVKHFERIEGLMLLHDTKSG